MVLRRCPSKEVTHFPPTMLISLKSQERSKVMVGVQCFNTCNEEVSDPLCNAGIVGEHHHVALIFQVFNHCPHSLKTG